MTAGFWADARAGASRAIAMSTSIVVLPVKGSVPVSISCSTTPNAKTSLRASTALPAACSGDMYAGVPSTCPSVVTCACVSAVATDDASTSPTSLARPKSRIFTSQSSVTMTLPGLRSRCTRPRSCAFASPRAIPRATLSASSIAIAPRSSTACRVSPSTSSIAMYTRPSASPTS